MTATTGVKGGFTHQTVHTCFSAQPTKGVFTGKLHGGRFNARDFTGRGFDDFALKAFVFTPAQVHAQHHVGPILSLGTTGTSLNIKVGVVGIHLTGEHATEFELLQFGAQAVQLFDDALNALFIFLLNRHIQQFTGISQPLIHGVDGGDNSIQL